MYKEASSDVPQFSQYSQNYPFGVPLTFHPQQCRSDEERGLTKENPMMVRPFSDSTYLNDAHDWIADLHYATESVGFCDTQKMQYAHLLLEGRAATWYRAHKYNIRSFSEFQDLFIERFAQACSSLYQYKDESVQGYSSRAYDFMDFIDSQYGPISESTAVQHYIQGLHPYISREVQTHDICSMDSAVDCALYYEWPDSEIEPELDHQQDYCQHSRSTEDDIGITLYLNAFPTPSHDPQSKHVVHQRPILEEQQQPAEASENPAAITPLDEEDAIDQHDAIIGGIVELLARLKALYARQGPALLPLYTSDTEFGDMPPAYSNASTYDAESEDEALPMYIKNSILVPTDKAMDNTDVNSNPYQYYMSFGEVPASKQLESSDCTGQVMPLKDAYYGLLKSADLDPVHKKERVLKADEMKPEPPQPPPCMHTQA